MKNLKFIIVFILLIVVLIIGNKVLTPNMDSQIKKYLIELGFKETEYEGLLKKSDVNNRELSFSLLDYTYMINVVDNISGMTSDLNATYYYKDEKIIYSYRVNYSDTVNIYFKGEMKDDDFTCNKDFSSAKLGETEKNNICELASINLKLFELEAKTLFQKYKFVDYIKNK